MPAPVATSWDRIEEWCQANDIANVLRPPASATDIASAEAEIGHRFPADLVESLLRHDGTNTRPMSFLVPTRWILLPLARMVEDWKWRTEDLAERQATEVDDMGDEDDDDWSDVEEGEEDLFWGWNREWLPIALDDTGCALVVDLRPGDRRGTVGYLDPQSIPRFDSVNTYSSTAALLQHTANALHGDGPQAARVENHGIFWN
jgi:cell wall assembly regulator SMI1